MKIFKSVPTASKQWQSDSISVKAMRIILPIAAVLSAISLAGGLASFLELNLTNTIHLVIAIGFVLAAFFFDGLGITSGRSVVRDFILSSKGEIERGVLFWINVSLAVIIAGAVVIASFNASRNGIKYLVIEAKKAKELRTQIDSTLTATIDQAQGNNNAVLEAKKQAYEAQRSAIVATYAGKLEAVTVDIAKRRRQRSESNKDWIDNKISSLEKQAAQLRAEQGEEIATLAATFAEEQSRILASSESLQAVTVKDAEEAAERRKEKQTAKDAADKQLSNLVSGIFSWAVVLMMVIGIRLELLEVRNNILPNPILSNSDLSGLEDARRFIMALPYFLFSWVHYGAEQLYHYAAKRQPPIVDNDLINYSAAQIEEEAIRKEGKIRTLPGRPAQRRAIGYNQAAPEPEQENNLPPLSSKFKPSLNQPSDDEKKAIVNQIKATKRELRKYKKRQSSSYQMIKAAERKGEEPRAQTVQAYENRTEWVNKLEAEIRTLENKLNSIN